MKKTHTWNVFTDSHTGILFPFTYIQTSPLCTTGLNQHTQTAANSSLSGSLARSRARVVFVRFEVPVPVSLALAAIFVLVAWRTSRVRLGPSAALWTSVHLVTHGQAS